MLPFKLRLGRLGLMEIVMECNLTLWSPTNKNSLLLEASEVIRASKRDYRAKYPLPLILRLKSRRKANRLS